MNDQVIKNTTWIAEESLVITEIKGPVSSTDIAEWTESLHSVLNAIPENTTFKIMVDMFGIAPQDVEIHKRFRNVIPLALAKHGWKVGYLNMFEEANDLELFTERGVQCVKAAHAHQDSYKIEEYDRRFGNEREHFFTDPKAAFEWLKAPAA